MCAGGEDASDNVQCREGPVNECVLLAVAEDLCIVQIVQIVQTVQERV